MSKPSLLVDRRFLPLFLSQFLGAFNDNAFKNSLLIWFTYEVAVAGIFANWLVKLGDINKLRRDGNHVSYLCSAAVCSVATSSTGD